MLGTNLGSTPLHRIGCCDVTGTPSSGGLDITFEAEFPACSCRNLDSRIYQNPICRELIEDGGTLLIKKLANETAGININRCSFD